jgi:hypothetical protein
MPLLMAQIGLAQSVASEAPAGSAESIVYVARRGWHIDVGMASADLTPPLDAVAADLPAARYVFFGFGDKHYLLAKNHNGPVLLSALWPGSAIVLATGLAGAPNQAFGAAHVIALRLRKEQVGALQAYIWKSLDTPDETLSIYKNGPYEDSFYYLATLKYSAFHTCNTWAAQALRAAGLPVRVKGVIFAGQLWSQVKRLSPELPAVPLAAPE